MAVGRARLREAWAIQRVRSRVPGIDAARLRSWFADLPPATGFVIQVRLLRYRTAPHLAAACWYEDQLIDLQVPEPFFAWDERVYYRARRKPGATIAFRWYARIIRFRTRREVLRFLYCHEFYHWYLHEVLHRKAAAETACDRFALAHFRGRNQGVDWSRVLPGYDVRVSTRLRRSA
jgi:hypothetical protein